MIRVIHSNINVPRSFLRRFRPRGRFRQTIQGDLLTLRLDLRTRQSKATRHRPLRIESHEHGLA